MVEERDDWSIVNVADGKGFENSHFAKVCTFEKDQKFPQTGIHLYILEPDKAACRYHRENAQEDFLILSGECRLIVNDEETPDPKEAYAGTGEWKPCEVPTWPISD